MSDTESAYIVGRSLTPHFQYRVLRPVPHSPFRGPWADHNGLSEATELWFGHYLDKHMPVPRPTMWWPMDATGVRKLLGHVCMSNREVVEHVAKVACEYFSSHPDMNMFSISPPDGSGHCMCDGCKALDVDGYTIPEGPREGRPVMTDRVLEFYNAVAELTVSDYPDRLLGGYVYADYIWPPKRVVSVHPNVALVVAMNRAYRIHESGVWQRMAHLYRFWGKFHRRIYAHDMLYDVRKSRGLPAPIGDRLPHLIRLLAACGYKGAYLYTGPTFESVGAEAHLAARLLWNPAIDVRKAETEYYERLYGGAASAVQLYYRLAEWCHKDGTYAVKCDDMRAALRTADLLDGNSGSMWLARLRENFSLVEAAFWEGRNS